jgi:G patch domain-containing protein 1
LEHFQKELEEYAQAAIVFKPLSGAMAGRFTTGTIVDHGYQTGEGLYTPSQEAPKPEPEPSTTVMAEKEVDAKTHAASTGMYGSFTREVATWIPAKLLCKRFGVKEPEIVESQEDHLSEKPSAKAWEPDAETTEAELIEVATASFTAEASGSVGASKQKRDLANIGLGEDETQGTDILTYERPGKDIFKAIFASDDEDSGDEDVKAEEEQEPLVPPSLDAVSKPEPAKPAASEPVDISSFKPVFVPRSEREGDTAGVEARKRKKDKEKKKGGKILVSFEVEDDGSVPPQKQRVRKKRKSKHIYGDEDEGTWVEKAVPDVVQTLRATTDSDAVNQVVDDADGKLKEEGPAKGRKRAVDFL